MSIKPGGGTLSEMSVGKILSERHINCNLHFLFSFCQQVYIRMNVAKKNVSDLAVPVGAIHCPDWWQLTGVLLRALRLTDSEPSGSF